MYQERHCCLYFLHMCTVITLQKKHVSSKFTSNLPQPIKPAITPSHVQYTLNNLTENVPQSTTNKVFLNSHHQLPIKHVKTSLQSLIPKNTHYLPFIQTIYSVALANLHTFVKAQPTHTESLSTKQHPYLVKYADMNQKSVSLSPCY